MDVELEFPTSPPKRQRTLSPEETRDASAAAQPIEAQSDANAKPEDHTPADTGIARSEANGDAGKASVNDTVGQNQDQPLPNIPDHDSNSLLDALMLQVEAASAPPPVSVPEQPTSAAAEPAAGENKDILNGAENTKGVDGHTDRMQDAQQQQPTEPRTTTDTTDHMDVTTDSGMNGDGQATQGDAHNGTESTITLDTNTTIPTVGNDSDTPAVATATATATMVDAIPPTETLAPEPGAEGAEWAIDSSPYESSSDSDDTTSSEEDSDEDEDDDDGDYAMLDPEEAARILMQGDGGSDDEGGGRNRGDKADGAPLRTAHERPEEVIPKPDIVVTEDMKIEELGNVEVVVENTVVIKAKTSGEYQVLETGSLICLPDRSVVGVVADLIGRVEEPRYTIRFTNDEDIKQAGLAEVGTTVFYVPQHSTFVFTQPLKAVKGSDASNFHDEEVAEDEMEFSDDEAEAEHKRQMKARRQGRSIETGRGRGGGGPSSRHPRGSHRGGGRGGANQSYGGSTEMNYDDVVDGSGGVGDEGYTPLQRPANMAEMMMTSPQEVGAGPSHSLPPKPSRGDFSRGRAGRGRGGGRGGNSRGGHHYHHQQQHGGGGGSAGFGQSSQAAAGSWNQQPSNNNSFQASFTPQQMQQMMSMQMPNFNLPAMPAFPQGIQFNNTPGSFNFNGFNNGASGANFPFMQQPQPQQQQQPQQPQQQGFPASFGLNFQQQQQQTYQQRWGGGQQQQQNMAAPASSSSNFTSGPWASNPALAAALQRQAQQEQERRNQG
ncbi:hypothetical protein KCU88_g5002, partial [Aureobasidium melanogenum]